MLEYDGNRLSRCDLVARLHVLLERNCVEVLGYDLLTARESVAATHGKDYLAYFGGEIRNDAISIWISLIVLGSSE